MGMYSTVFRYSSTLRKAPSKQGAAQDSSLRNVCISTLRVFHVLGRFGLTRREETEWKCRRTEERVLRYIPSKFSRWTRLVQVAVV